MSAGDDHLALDRLARLHYEHGMTHQEIAELFGVSRVKVTRRLAEARRRGVVKITIDGDEHPFVDLETRLARRFSLGQAWVAPRLGDNRRSLESLGLTGAQCLSALVPGRRTLAVGTSSSVAAAVDALRPTAVGELDVVPIAGSWSGRANATNPHELALRLATAFGGRAYHLPVPFLASTAEVAATLLADEAVRETLAVAAAADVLLVGIGGTDDSSGLLVGSVSREQLGEVVSAGAVGDVSGRFFDAQGAPVRSALDDRVVGLDLERLRHIPMRVAIAAGPSKLPAITTALTHGLLTVLVTDAATATALLETPVAATG